MKMLGSLLLPETLQWIDQYARSPVARTVVHTLSGTPVAHGRKVWDQPITLAATGDTTWLDLSTTEALAQMAAEVDGTYPLIWQALTMTVAFRHQEPPALDLTPVWPHQHRFVGTIRLVRV